ncbi:MAG: DUF5723 family protein [Crocinitomicaceae bacterium]
MKHLLLLVHFLLVSYLGFTQNHLGYSEDNYSGVHAGYSNPAFLADNRLLVDVSAISLSVNAYNDYAYFSPRNMPYGFVKTFVGSDSKSMDYRGDTLNNVIVPFGQVPNYRNTLNSGNLFEFENISNIPRTAFYNHELAILNLMVSFDQDVAFSFGVKQRTFINFQDVSYDLLSLGRTTLQDSAYWNVTQTQQNVNISFNSWNEYALGLAAVVYNKKKHFIKTGLNLKYLQGIAGAYIGSNDISYFLSNADTAASISGEIDYGTSENLQSSQFFNGDISAEDFGIDFRNPFSGGGRGFGIDIGVVYEWRPNYEDFQYEMDGQKGLERPNENKYRIRLALAVNDIGGINYNRSNESRKFSFADNLTNFDLNQLKADSLGGFNNNIAALELEDKVTYIGNEQSFFMNLPTHINASVDFLVFKNFYLNGNVFLSTPFSKNGSRSIYYSNFSFSPRYEHRYFSLAVPVSYSRIYKMRVGVSARITPYVVLGTSNLLPFFSSGKDVEVAGADFFLTLKVPILKRTKKDTDGDLVSDKLDLCVKTPGVWAFRGCPDSDNDGVQDSEDRCPSEPGKTQFSGCPDRDDDQIIDREDDCPDIAGLPEFNGCPDTDGDKIIDSNDECPNIPGLIEFKGCPDSDGDGIKDTDDLCPNAMGPMANNGCPDTDADGLFDYLDECPEVSGPKENKGCPWPDTDNDGILDKDDKCPLNTGPVANGGCPYIDTDGDGILDKDDDCVNVAGTINNSGCPEIEEKEKEILKTAFNNLEFEVAEATIKESSYQSLDDLAALMGSKPNWKLKIEGHTDSQGGEQNNLILSKKRAEAVKKYLLSNGIIDAERLQVGYFGEDKPIADNSTLEGRQANRRVELNIMFE